MRSVIAVSFVVFLASSLVGCGGGFNCPFERPSCCDNLTFGCGPFDIPQGCSCGDYFSRSFNNIARARQEPLMTPARARAVGSAGTWRISASQTVSDGCPLLPKSVTYTVLIREKRRRVQVKVPGYLMLRGKRAGRKVRTQGSYSVALLGCRGSVRGDVNLRDPSNASLRVAIDATCENPDLSCDVTYEGSARRL